VRCAALLMIAVTLPASLLGQSSLFSARGLGYPGRELSARAAASGGAFGMFDPQSSINPAALGGIDALTTVFTINHNFMSPENPAGSASTRDTRFPQMMIVGPVQHSGAALGLSYSNYTSRDFTLASTNTVDLRGVPVGVSDSLQSRGGLADLRLAGAYRVHDRWVFGGALHILTGSNRLQSRRFFDDPTYLSSTQRAEISYAGLGFSVGLLRQFGSSFSVGAVARTDGHVNVDQDSSRVAQIDLPYSFGLGLRWHPTAKLDLGAQGLYHAWSGANSDLLAQGGTGAVNTGQLSVGGEYTPNGRHPSRWPLRFGGHYAQLPFPLVPGDHPHEIRVSIGTGMRFGQERGGIDLTGEHVWRSEGTAYSETAFVIGVGVSLRP
jgi:long-subunit fatty acid transport protein